jgi:hypothetical protein
VSNFEILAVAEFTADMAATLNKHFAAYADDGIVTLEVSNRGLWLVHPVVGSRQFLGLARLPPSALGSAESLPTPFALRDVQ